MIHEYAIDPSSVFQKDGFWSLLKDFGIAQGRVLVEYPDTLWRQNIEKSLWRAKEEFGDVAFSKLTECWRSLRFERNGIVRRKSCCTNSTSTDWLFQVLPEHKREPFHALLMTNSDGSIAEVLTRHEIDLGDKRWQPETQKIVKRDAAELANCAGPLGRISTELLFIDPYFNDDRKWRQSLIQTLNACRADDGHFSRIEVHTSEYKDHDRHQTRTHRSASKSAILKEGLQKTLPKALPRSVSVKFFVWSEREQGERYHRRYILTERGGISFEGGLDGGPEGQSTDVALLTDSVYRQRWSEYQENTAPFDLAGDPFVISAGQ